MRWSLVPTLLVLASALSAAEGLQATFLDATGAAVGTAVVGLDGTAPAGGVRGLYQGFLRAPGQHLTLDAQAGFPLRVVVRRVDLNRPGGWRDEEVTVPARLETTPGEPLEVRVTVAGTGAPRVRVEGDGPVAIRAEGFPSAGGLGAEWTLATGARLVPVAPDTWQVTGFVSVTAWNRVQAEWHATGAGSLALGPVRVAVDAEGRVTVEHPPAGWTAGASDLRGPFLRLRRDGPSLRAWCSTNGEAWVMVGRFDDRDLASPLNLVVEGSGVLTAGNSMVLGGNLGGVATWSALRPFNNLVLGGTGPAWAMDADGKVIKTVAKEDQRGKFGKTIKAGALVEQPAPLDVDGWPTTDFLFKGPYNQPAEGFSGVPHVLTFTGQARIAVVQPGSTKGVRVTPASETTGDADFVDGYRAADNTSRWYLEVTGAENLGLSPGFFSTRRTPESPLGSGVTRIDLRRVMDDGDTGLYRREFLRLVQPFSSFRMMDWGETNHSVLARWEDRILPGADGHGEGIQAYEHMIALANATGSDLWLNLPALADEDFVTRLLTLVRDGSTVRGTTWPGLRPDLNCIIEFSNECWNGAFLVAKQLTDRIAALRAAGTTYGPQARPLGYGLPKGAEATIPDGDLAMRYQYIAAHAATVIVPAISTVFGPEAVGTRIRPYLGGWKNFPEKTLLPAVQFLADCGWEPRRIYAAAGPTGYFGGKALAEASGKGTAQADVPLEAGKAFFLDLDGRTDAAKWSAGTTAWGLDLVAYEAGPAIGETPAMAAFQVDPAFRTAVVRGMNAWYSAGGGLSHWFAISIGRYGNSFGDWNLSDTPGDLFHPRFQAMSDLLGVRSTPPLAMGHPARPGQRIGVDQHLGKDRGLPGWGEVMNLPPDRPLVFTYLLASDEEQTLDLRLVGAGGQGVQVRLLNQDAQSLRLPTTFGVSDAVTVRLCAGLNLLTLSFSVDPGGERAMLLDELLVLAPGSPGVAQPLLAMSRSKTSVPQVTVGKTSTLRLNSDPGVTLVGITGDLTDQEVALKSDAKQPDRSSITVTAARAGRATLHLRLGDRQAEVPIDIVAAVPGKPPSTDPRNLNHAMRVVAQEGFLGAPENLSDGTPKGVETSEATARLALTGLPAGGLDTLMLSWGTFTNPPFVLQPTVAQSRLGTIDIAWSATPPANPLDPAGYTTTLPTRSLAKDQPWAPAARLATGPHFTSDLTGLGIPAGAQVLLTFHNQTPAMGRPMQIEELRAAGPAPTSAPRGVAVTTTWMQNDPASFANPAGPRVTLTWDAVPGAWAMPVVQASQDGTWNGAAAEKKASMGEWTLSPGLTSFVHDRRDPTRGSAADNPPLEPGSTWHYRVGWAQPGAAPRFGAPVTLTLATTSGIPAPSNVSATLVDVDHLRLSWDAVPGATAYKVERRESEKAPWMLWGRVQGTTATDASVDQDHDYTYRVRAVTTPADGPAADGDWALIQIPRTPKDLVAPQNLVRRDLAGVVSLSWDFAPGRGTAFEVLRGSTADDLQPLATTTYPRFTDRPPQGTWVYAVRTLGHDAVGTPLRSPLVHPAGGAGR